MKIVKYIGGLGNQMFTYAFSKVLEETFAEDVYADTLYYKDHTFHNGLELENIFDIKLKKASFWQILKLTWVLPNYYLDYHLRWKMPDRKTAYYEQAGGAYDPNIFLNNPGNRFYFGFWQDHRNFDSKKELIQNAFVFKAPLTGDNKKVWEEMTSSEASVAIHVRRGDYLKSPKYVGICDLPYYTKAIELVKSQFKNPKFFIFSNDIAWCKENLLSIIGDCQAIFIDWNTGNKSYIDMQLMTGCKSLIIANSSFSWWGAYLNKRDPFVISPKKWKNNFCGFDFPLEEWTRI